MSIKRTIITAAVILASVAMVAPLVGAQTPTIAQLMAEIQQLTAQLNTLQGSTTTTTTSGSLPTACVGVTFTRNLVVGSTGSDVKCLQVILNQSASTRVSTTGAGSPGYETTTFGPKTLAAVKIWQANAGFVPANQIGPMSRAKLNAWLGGTSSTTTTTTTSGLVAGCTSTVGFSQTTGASCATGVIINQSGSISAMLSSDTPASGAIIASQATADLLNINFAGQGVVTSVTLQRSGISDQNALTNVYLFDGNTRITDGYSFNASSQIVMNGLNIAVNGSHEISVRADVESTVTTEASIAVALTGYTANGTTSSANVMGNTFTIVTGSAATVTLSANTVSTAASVNAGVTGYTFWSAPLQINTRSVLLKTANFRMIGSAPIDALANIHMFVDGVDTGKIATVTTINGSNYASFDLTSAPITLTTGSHTIDMRADVQKGTYRDVTVSVQQASDLTIFDPQVGVNIASGGTFPNSAAKISISQGTVTVNIDPTFLAQTNISSGATNAVIARYIIHAYGENVKINTLQVNPYITSGVATGCTTTDSTTGAETGQTACGLENVTLYFNGSQVGSQKNFTQTSTDAENSTTAANDMAAFSLGSQVIAPAGQDSVLEIRADLFTTGGYAYSSGNVKVILPFTTSTGPNYGNGQGMSSSATTNVYLASATNGLTISSASLVVSSNANFLAQAIAPNTTGAKVGSYIVQNQSTSESVRLTSLTVDLETTGKTILTTTPAMTNFYALRTSDTTGNGSTPIQPSATIGSNKFSVSDVLAPGASMTIDVFANTGADSSSSFISALTVASIGVVDNSASSGTIAYGPTLTFGTGTVGLPTLVVSSTTPAQYIAAAGGATNATQATFNFVSTSGPATIQELKFTVSGSDATASNTVTQVCVGSVCASPVTETITGLRVADLTGLNLAVPNGGGGLTQNVQVSYSSVGTGGITPGTIVQTGLSYVKYAAGGATVSSCPSAYTGWSCSNTTLSSVLYAPSSSTSITLVGSKPTVVVNNTSVAGLNISGVSQKIGEITISADPKGNIKLNDIQFLASGANFTTQPTYTLSYLAAGTSGTTAIAGSSCGQTSGASASATIFCEFGSGTLATTTDVSNVESNVDFDGYTIAAGQSQTFSLYATVSGANSNNTTNTISTSLVAAGFNWDDTSYNGTYGVNNTGTAIYGFPTNSYSTHS